MGRRDAVPYKVSRKVLYTEDVGYFGVGVKVEFGVFYAEGIANSFYNRIR